MQTKILSALEIVQFQEKIYQFYERNRRSFAWRENYLPYNVFISEVMLQQTQTSRVVLKYEQWLSRFDSFAAVAAAPSHDILLAWQGLGYNRRAIALQKAAQTIVQDFAGQLPADPKLLQMLPGIGPNTAGSICAFAFNLPVVFIETNIRSVFLHEFFAGRDKVDDKEILHLVQQTLPTSDARNWYYALMDYGVFLKKEMKVKNSASKQYVRQSKFLGSRRQVRGAIIRMLAKAKSLLHQDLVDLVQQELPNNYHDVELVLQQLVREALITSKDDRYFL